MATGYHFSKNGNTTKAVHVTDDVVDKVKSTSGPVWIENRLGTEIIDISQGGQKLISAPLSNILSIDGTDVDPDATVEEVIDLLIAVFPEASSGGGNINFTALGQAEWNGNDAFIELTADTDFTMANGATSKGGMLKIKFNGHAATMEGTVLDPGSNTQGMLTMVVVDGEYDFSFNPGIFSVPVPVVLTTPAAPTAPVTDDTANTFGFTLVSGYAALSSYEYTLNGGSSYSTVTANPIAVGNFDKAIGQVGVRLKAVSGVSNPSGTLYNTVAFVAVLTTPATPSSPVTDDTADTFGWTYSAGYTAYTDYEYTLNGGTSYFPCTAKPQPVGNISGPIGLVGVRVKGVSGVSNPSATLYNTVAFTVASGPSLVDLDFSANTLSGAVFTKAANAWTATGSAPSGFEAAQDLRKRAAGTAAYVQCEFHVSTSYQWMLGWDNGNTPKAYNVVDASFWLAGASTLTLWNGGASGPSAMSTPVATGSIIRVELDASDHVNIYLSTDGGVTFNYVETITGTVTGDAWPNLVLLNGGVGSCYNPQGYNLV